MQQIHTSVLYISRLFFIIHFYTQCVDSRAQGEVRIVLDTLTNTYNTNQNNECCSGSKNYGTLECSKPCDMFISICITPGVHELHLLSCLMGTKRTRNFSNNNDGKEIAFRLPSSNLTEPVYGDLTQSVRKMRHVEELDALVYRIDQTLLNEVYYFHKTIFTFLSLK